MPGDMLFVFGLLAVTIVLFVSDRVRLDVVALLVIITLPLSGVLTVGQAVAGFGDPVVLLIAALFVVGEGLFRTGVAAAVGAWLLRMGGNGETRLLLFLLPTVAVLSAFMSSTGAVAIFIPVVLSLAREANLSPGRLLLPLAYASLIGGMLTLIGTPPNLVASAAMEQAGFAPFRFFDFTPIGLAILVAALAYLPVAVRLLLPARDTRTDGPSHPPLREFARRYGVEGHLHRLRVRPGSPLAGETVFDHGLRRAFRVTVVGIKRGGLLLPSLMPVLEKTRMEVGDLLFAEGAKDDVERLCAELDLEHLGFPEGELRRMHQVFGAAEVLIPPESPLLGKSIQEARFRHHSGLSVIGLRRDGRPVPAHFTETRLAMGDTLLLLGGWQQIQALSQQPRVFVVLETPAELDDAPPHADRAPLALGIVAAMLALMTTGTVPALVAALLAALAMVACRCVTMDESYRAMNWSSLVLIAGMLPLATALEKTGGVALIVDALVAGIGSHGPLALCAGLFLLTSLLSQFISNTATAVLVAPIAMAAAAGMGLQPAPFMMTVAIAATSAFGTPMATPVNTLVLAPGRYRFMDFVKLGAPLQLIAMVLTLAIVPLLFPF